MAVEVPDGLTTFKLPDGKSFAVDLIEACQAINRIADASKEAGEKNLEYVDRFVAWVAGKTGVDLSKAQADWVMDFCGAEFAREKKARLPAPTPNSLLSTEPES